MTKGTPVFEGDEDTTAGKTNSAWNGVGPPPEDNGKAELYAREREALKELIEKHGWPKGCPEKYQRGETVLMLMEWLGDDLCCIDRVGEVWKIIVRWQNGSYRGQSLILALCAAVMAKLEEERDA